MQILKAEFISFTLITNNSRLTKPLEKVEGVSEYQKEDRGKVSLRDKLRLLDL